MLTIWGFQVPDPFAISISLLALFISIFSYYKTYGKGFHIHLVPTKRVTLTWYQDKTFLLIPIEIINSGAKSGIVDDIILSLKNKNGGSDCNYIAAAARRRVDIFIDQGQPRQNFQDLNSIWINGKEAKELYILFQPSSDNFELEPSTYEFKFWYTTDCSHDQWLLWRKILSKFGKNKPTWDEGNNKFEVEIDNEAIKAWKLKQVVRIDSNELVNCRKNFFSK